MSAHSGETMAPQTPFHTVIVPTCNHPDLLKRCLETILQTDSPQFDWEILVMDNSEKTYQLRNREVVQSIGDNHIRYIEMTPLAGSTAARHLGAEIAVGEILSFIDDDSFVGRPWLKGIQDAFLNTDATIVGGSNIPENEVSPPDWLEYFWYKTKYGKVCDILSLIDFGQTEKPIPANFVFSCNLSIRKNLFWRVGGTNPDYLPAPKQKYQGDGETALSVRVEAHGGKSLYKPDCSIRHYVPKSRMAAEYFGNRAFFNGLHSSFTQIRRDHGLGPSEGVPRRRPFVQRALGMVKRTGSQLWTRYVHDEPEEVKAIRKIVHQRFREGWLYHQNEVEKDPALLEYVLRKNYIGTAANIPGEDRR
jgi:GT2 family glycosyltransferase